MEALPYYADVGFPNTWTPTTPATRRFHAFIHDETPKLMERWRQLRSEG